MSRKSRRAIVVVSALLLLVAGVGMALFLTNRREVTTTSAEAYQAYRQAIADERRFYSKEARVGFARAVELDPSFVEAMLGLARQSDRDQAISLTERAGRLRDRLTDRERMHVDMQLAAVKGERQKMMDIARSIHAKYPEDIRAAMALAHNEIATGHTEKALAIFADLLAIEPNNADAYNQIGYFYGYRGDYEKAIDNLKKYAFMAPDQANPFDSLGEIEAYSGRYDEAIAHLKQALAIKPDFFEAYGHLGVAYEGKGDYPAAIQNYTRAAEDSPTDSQRRGSLARALRVCLESGDRAAAEKIVARMASLPPDKRFDFVKPFAQAALALVDGKPAEAERLLMEMRPKALEYLSAEIKDPSYKPYLADWNFLMAHAKVALGKTEEAMALYDEMIHPPNPWSNFEGRRWVYEARARQAELLARQGNLDKAEQLLAENHKWNPSWAPSRPAELAVAQLRREKVLAAEK